MISKFILSAATVMAALAAATAAQAGQCRDPWVTQAVREVTGREPNGAGESGECRYTSYGAGQWSSYPDLLGKVRAVLGQRGSAPPAMVRPNAPQIAPNINGGRVIGQDGAGLINDGGAWGRR